LGSRPGDTVLDPFGGSGTTGVAAKELDRNAVLVELNPKYCRTGRERARNSEKAWF
jgi:DNA modification methylase